MSHGFIWAGLVLSVTALGLAMSRPLGRWYRKVRRRKGGVYLVRVDHHRNRARRVNGYVGETVSFYFRRRQHLGASHFRPDGTRAPVAVKSESQPWSDLRPVWHEIPLPWWLCWKWVLRPLETLVILCTWPIYNDAKNRWNPRRIPRNLAQMQRRTRDNMATHGLAYPVRVWTAHLLRKAAFLVLALSGLGGTLLWVTR